MLFLSGNCIIHSGNDHWFILVKFHTCQHYSVIHHLAGESGGVISYVYNCTSERGKERERKHTHQSLFSQFFLLQHGGTGGQQACLGDGVEDEGDFEHHANHHPGILTGPDFAVCKPQQRVIWQ